MRKGLVLLLSVALTFTMFPMPVFAADTAERFSPDAVSGISSNNEVPEFTDLPENWSKEALRNVAANGLLQGYNGEIRPGDNLTRAQMAAVINRAFGALKLAPLDEFKDVPRSAWYYDDMAKAVQMGTFTGAGNGLLQPDKNITREDAFLALSRAFRVETLPSGNDALNVFSDQNRVGSWAKDGVSAMVASGYISGSAGKLNPKSNIKRAEFAQLMDNLLKQYITKSGNYSEVPSGNIMINVPGVTLKNVEIKGDLIIGDGVGDGEVTLDNVAVTGRMVVRGGGEHSIVIKGDSSIRSITIVRTDGKVRVYAQDGAEIGEVIVDGRDDVIVEGSIDSVLVLADHVTVTALKAAVEKAQIEGDHSVFLVKETSSINTATVRGDHSAIKGEGTVKKVFADGSNVTVETLNTAVTASKDADNVKAGEQKVKPGETIVTGTSKPSASSSGGGGSNNNNEPDEPDEPSEDVAAPAVLPAAGEVTSGTAVTLTTATSGAKIYFTVDGSAPTTSGMEYTKPIVITQNITIQAIAVKTGMNNSSILTAAFTVAAAYEGPFAGGTGTEEDPYEVATAEQLDLVRDHLDAHYVQIEDIDLTDYLAEGGAGYNGGEGWIPIGIFNQYNSSVSFTGSYDGDGYTITGLTINRPSRDDQGLFGCAVGADLTDIHFIAPLVEGDEVAGSLVAKSYSVITDCSASSVAIYCEDDSAGGLVGENYGTITNCSATGTVKCDYANVGGLVGYNSKTGTDSDSYHAGLIQNCYSDAEVTYLNAGEQELEKAGGLVGNNSGGSIQNCHATGNVTGNEYAGGLIGHSWKGTVTDCYATGDVNGISDYDGGSSHYVGGLIGESSNNNVVKDCWASGKVIGQSEMGGLAGHNASTCTIESCYVAETDSLVSGSNQVGGLVGDNGGTITKSYTKNTVSGGSYLGGLCGYSSSGIIEFCYSDSTVTGTGGADSAGGLCGGIQNTFVHDCYAEGTVSSYREAGGLCGYLSVGASVQNCYSTGIVTGSLDVGGLVGKKTTSETLPTVTASFYNQDTSGQSDDSGKGSPLTTAQMTAQSSFSGWDFTAGTGVWTTDSSPASYPYLQWQSDDIPYPPSDFDGGTGTASDPYEVATAEQLDKVRDHLDAHFIQTADIDLSDYLVSGGAGYNEGKGWQPIGSALSPFSGSFDGEGFRISGLKIDRPEETHIGMFGDAAGSANLSEIYMVAADVSGKQVIGGLVGLNSGAIRNCSITGSVESVVTGSSAEAFAGGLVGSSFDGLIESCYVDCTVSSGAYYTGGLVGQNGIDSEVRQCFARGSVNSAKSIAGGLAGRNAGEINDSYSTASVNGETFVGGLAGYADSTSSIANCYAAGRVNGSSNEGGIVGGNNSGTVTECYYDSVTTGQSDSGKGAGLDSAEMRDQDSFSAWDFADVWTMDSVSYPYLQWQGNENIPYPIPV